MTQASSNPFRVEIIAGGGGGNAIATAGAGLATNSWTSFTVTNTYNTDPDGNGGSSWDYSPRLAYSNGKVFHYGGIHSNPASGRGNVIGVYDVATNAWGAGEGVDASAGNYLTHGYDMATADNAGQLYYMVYGYSDTHLYKRATNGVQSLVKTLPAADNITRGLAFHPNYGSAGGIVIGDDLYLQVYDIGANTVNVLINGVSNTMGAYAQTAIYVPAHDAVYVGGGSGLSTVHKVNANGTHSTIATPPVNPSASSGGNGALQPFTATSTSGLILLDVNGNNHYEFNGTSWTGALGSLNAAFLASMDGDKMCARCMVPKSITGLAWDLLLFFHCASSAAKNPSTTAHIWRY